MVSPLSFECKSFPNYVVGLTLWSFLQRQAQFSQFVSSNSSLTMSRYLRLMALAGVEVLCTTPISIFLMVLNLTAAPLDPWVSWSDTHFNFSRVGQFPAVLWTLDRWLVVGIQVNRWSGPFCAFIFFAFFGFASEARKNYCNAFAKVLVACKLKRDRASPQKSSPMSVISFHFISNSLIFLQSSQAHSHVIHVHVSFTSRLHPSSTPLPILEHCNHPRFS